MPIIKQKDIYDSSKGNPVKELKEQLEALLIVENKLTEHNKKLSESLQMVKKSNDGSEAKKLVSGMDALTKSTSNLTNVQKERLKVRKQLDTSLAKSIIANEKNNKVLAKGKVRIAEQNKVLKQQAREALGLVGAYEKLSKQTTEAQKKFKNLAAQLGTNSTQAKKARLDFEKLDNKLRNVNNAAKDGRRDVGRYGLALKGVGSQLMGALGLTAGLSALVNVFKNAGKISIDFEKSTSKLASILGKTKDEISSLTEQAKTLGATSAFTASQVIALQTELAKLGFTTKQIEQSSEAILNLAAATGTDLAESAELAGATLRIFNMDASQMSRVSDVLAKSTTISSLSMEKLATILPTVGKTAQLAGVSLERTAALAGTLTDRGLDASSAATSLRNIFLELSKKGITWEQAMEKINNSTDKNKASMNLFGKRAAAAGVILSETASSTDMLTGSLENAAGAAKEMGDAMLDNVAGDVTKAKSAWEGLILSIESGDGVISRAIRNITQYFTGLFQAIKNFNDGSASMDDFTKKRIGFTAKLNNALAKQDEHYKKITDTQKRSAAAVERYKKLKENLNTFERDALRASIDGEEKVLATSVLKIDYVKALMEGMKKYLPLIESENELLNETNLETKKLTTSQQKLIEQQKTLNAERERRKGTSTIDKVTTTFGATSVSGGADPVEDAKELGKEISKNSEQIKDAEREKEKLKLEENAAIQKDINQTLITEGANFASDIFAQGQDEKLERIKNDIEIEKALQKDRLEKGLITETQYSAKIAQLNKKSRREEARAEKRKALFDIAMKTAVAVVNVLATETTGKFAKAIAVGVIGGIQAAIVAARPLPKAEKGGLIGGNRHSNGGTVIEAEKGEYIVSRNGYSNAPRTTEMINKGLIKDSDFKKSMPKDLVSGKIDKLNTISEGILTAVSNNVGMYELNGMRYIKFGDGTTFKQIIN